MSVIKKEKGRRTFGGHGGGARSSDPVTSFLAANDVDRITALQRLAIQAYLHADRYPGGGMTSTDVARFHGHNNRDSFSPRVTYLRDWGLLVFVEERPCLNMSGMVSPMESYRL